MNACSKRAHARRPKSSFLSGDKLNALEKNIGLSYIDGLLNPNMGMQTDIFVGFRDFFLNAPDENHFKFHNIRGQGGRGGWGSTRNPGAASPQECSWGLRP